MGLQHGKARQGSVGIGITGGFSPRPACAADIPGGTVAHPWCRAGTPAPARQRRFGDAATHSPGFVWLCGKLYFHTNVFWFGLGFVFFFFFPKSLQAKQLK